MTPAELEQRRTAAVRARAVSHARARARARTDARIEDLVDLHTAGVPLEDAIARAGWSSIMAARSALTRRRHPLARPVNRLVHQERAQTRAAA